MKSLDPIRDPDFGDSPLVDLPLSGAESDPLSLPSRPARLSGSAEAAASLSARMRALAADGAVLALLISFCGLLATNLRAQPLRPASLPWAAAFALNLSVFTTVLPLVLFGRTIGMALAGLSARPAGSPPLTFRESFLRWLGTLIAAAALGFPLLWTARNAEEPTLADRLSGRALVESDPGDAA
ncbi:MAG TPA: RDD family protein [Thermoanaerobaculia bacterium]